MVNKEIKVRHPFPHLVRDLKLTFHMIITSVDFIREHELWKGLNNYRWLSKGLVILGILLGLVFFRHITNFLDSGETQNMGVLQSTAGLMQSVWEKGKSLFVIGSYKYVILFLIEVVVFHFVRVTLMEVTGEKIDTSFKTFVSTQKRMVFITIFCMVMENVMSTVLNVPLNILGAEFLSPVLFVLVTGFYTGFIILDNYNEVYHMSLRQSNAYNWQYAGVTIIVGLIVAGLLLVPFFGAILGPIVGAVIATRTMHELYIQDHDRAWVYDRYIPKKKRVNASSAP